VYEIKVDGDDFYVIYIDARTGEVIGGDQCA